MFEIRIVGENGEVRAGKRSEAQVVLVYEGVYEPGDKIIFTVPEHSSYYVIRADDCLDEALVYLAGAEFEFTIPFEEKRISYNPKVFAGERHYLTIRSAGKEEIQSYRNLAKNVLDQHGDTGCFPHAAANVETRGESVFAARNAIDGVVANESHGAWPYQSWGINRREDAQITIDFGRMVSFNRVVLYTRADFPHDSWWTQATLSFSDGSREIVSMERSEKPHEFHIVRKNVSWIAMSEMKKADDPSPFPALTQIEVYGKE